MSAKSLWESFVKIAGDATIGLLMLVAFSAVVVLAYQGKDAGATIVLVSFLVLLVFSDLDRYEQFGISLTGLRAKLRDVRDVTEDAREATESARSLAVHFSKMALLTVEMGGRWGGASDEAKARFKAKLENELRSMNIPSASIESVSEYIWPYTEFDYVSRVLSIDPSAINSPNTAGVKAQDRLNELNTIEGTRPSPEELERFFADYSKLTPYVQHLIDCYRHFRSTREHQDAWAWSDQGEWPLNILHSIKVARGESGPANWLLERGFHERI